MIAQPAFADSSHAEKLPSEAREGWRALRNAGLHVEGSATYRMGTAQDAETPISWATTERWDFKRNDESIVFECFTLADGGSQRPRLAGAQNSSYAFSLDAAAEGGSAKWLIKRLGVKRPSNPATFAKGAGFLLYLCAPYSISTESLSDLMNDDLFVVRSVAEEMKDGVPMVKVVFSYPFYVDPERKTRATEGEGWVIMNPSNSWAVEEYSMDVEFPGQTRKVTATVRIRYDPMHRLLPRTIVSERTFLPESTERAKIELTFDYLNQRVIPESEFMLTALGLPEIDPKEFGRYGVPEDTGSPRPGPAPALALPSHYLWIAAALLGSIALGLKLRNRRARKAR